MERRKHATFLSQFNQFLEKEIELSADTMSKFSTNLNTHRDLINSQSQVGVFFL